MSLEEDIVRLLKQEGYRINEAVRDAIDDLIDVVEDENDFIDDGDGDMDDDDEPVVLSDSDR